MLTLKLSSLGNVTISETVQCVVDSGASLCLFNADVAEALGLELKSGTRQIGSGISGFEEIWIHEITLHLPGGHVRVKAAFKENLPLAGLLGMGGFFEFFTITFDSAMERCTFERIYRT